MCEIVRVKYILLCKKMTRPKEYDHPFVLYQDQVFYN
jgi:hypothetical protein